MTLVIFDFDGVIVDSEKEKFEVVRAILKKYHCSLTDADFNQFIGRKRSAFLKQKYPDINIPKVMQQIHGKDNHLRFEPVSGIKELLSFLKQRGAKICVATGSERATVEMVLTRHRIVSYFDLLVTGTEIKESKPDPAAFHKAMSAFPPTDVYIVEDSPAGIQAAKETEATVIGFGTQNLEVDYSVSSHGELRELFSRLLSI